jgi:two-component system, cell cycle sensor histidine kinase and response regulator CckA
VEACAVTILVVDDEPSVLRYIASSLQRDGYDVLQADGGDEALTICKSEACCFDLIISDVAMPRMNGRELAECMNQRHPGVPIMFVSGYPESRQIVEGLTARGFEYGYVYLQKPFTPEDLRDAVRTALKSNHIAVGGSV